MNALALLGLSALLAWLGLPLLHRAASSPAEARPASRFRALLLAWALGAALFALPGLRAGFDLAAPARVQGAVEVVVERQAVREAADLATPPLAWLGAAWVLLAGFGLARFLFAAARAARLSGAESELPAPVAAAAERLARELGIAPPRVVVSGRAAIPFVRAFPATVVLPALLLESLDEDDLALVLRHELTHLARLDHLAAVALALLEIPFTLHPSARRLHEEIGLAREMAVDARVGAVAPRAYAHLLVEVVERHRFGPREAVEVALDSSSLERRIEMLVRTHPHRASRLWPLVVVALALAGVAVAAPAPAPAAGESGEQQVFNLGVERVETLFLDGAKIQRIAIGNPKVVDVDPLGAHEVRLLGRAPGRTTLLIWTDDGRKHTWLVVVK